MINVLIINVKIHQFVSLRSNLWPAMDMWAIYANVRMEQPALFAITVNKILNTIRFNELSLKKFILKKMNLPPTKNENGPYFLH